jgi:HAE1 family hydrophobic/amphiphilic exporter-1
MGLTRLAIARPIAILMVVAAFLTVGLIGYFQLPAELNPDIEFPTITVRTNYTGTSPQEMETLITRPIENSIAGVSSIQEIDSTSQQGVSTVRILFYFGTNLDTADSEVIQKVDAIRAKLPIAATSPSVQQADTNGQPIMNIAMQSPDISQSDLDDMATNIVQPALEQATDVGAVNVNSGSTREIHVDLDPNKLAAYGIGVPDIVNALGAANVDVASGFIQNASAYYDVRLIGQFASVDEIQNLKVSVGGSSGSSGGTQDQGSTPSAVVNSSDLGPTSSSSSTTSKAINLADLGTVSDTIAEPTTSSLFQDRPAIQLSILKTTNGNTLAACDSVKQELKSVAIDLPASVKFTISFDQSTQVTENMTDVVSSLVLGAFLAICVVYIFLHNARGTLIIAIAIPTSMIATFVPLWAFGFTLNSYTLLGLSLAVGILVDDSIVVLENINRHLGLGEEPMIAAIKGRTEIGLAALTLTSVDLVVFLPIAFMGGVIGLLYRSFGITVAFATLFSLFVSFTLTPMLAARWYRKGESLESDAKFAVWFDGLFKKLEGRYQKLLGFSIRNPWWVVGASLVFIALIFIFVGSNLGFRFAPDQDQGQVTVTIEAPAGSPLSYTERIATQIQNMVKKTPDLTADTKFISTTVGSSGPGLNITGTQYGHVDITLWDRRSILDDFQFWKHDHLRDRADTAVAQELKQLTRRIVGAKVLPSNVNGFGGGAPLTINLIGPDMPHLSTAANAVMTLLHNTAGVYNIDSTFQAAQPEVDVRLDRVKAADYGLSLQSVANGLASSVAGDVSVQYRDPNTGNQYNLRVEVAKPYRSTPQQIANVIVGNDGGTPVHLGDIAEITIGNAPVQLTRLNRQEEVQVTAYVLNGYSVGRIGQQVFPAITKMHLPLVQATYGGELQRLGQNVGYLYSAFFLGIILTYMLMAALFNNMAYPLSIMLSLPQAWAGGIIALAISHQSLSIISMMGVVLLNAIVNKNAILLVDYTNTLRARGYKRMDAIMLAGPTRLKPIMMTTFTIIVSTLPTALALGRGAQFRQSLGIVVEGGIIISLLLTLLVVPAAYVLYDNATEWIARKKMSWAQTHNISAETLEHHDEDHAGGPGSQGGVRLVEPEVLVGAEPSTNGHGSAGRVIVPTNGVKNGNVVANGNHNGNGHASNGKSKTGGKYGRIIIRSRRPDELFERYTKGDGKRDEVEL